MVECPIRTPHARPIDRARAVQAAGGGAGHLADHFGALEWIGEGERSLDLVLRALLGLQLRQQRQVQLRVLRRRAAAAAAITSSHIIYELGR